MDTGWDDEKVYSANLQMPTDADEVSLASDDLVAEQTASQAAVRFRQFIRLFRVDDNTDDYIYRKQLSANYEQGDYYLLVDTLHLSSFDRKLENSVRNNPTMYVPIFEEAAKTVIQHTKVPRPNLSDLPDCQVQFKNFNVDTDIRNLSVDNVNRVVTVRGIVISASRATTKATELALMCKNCKYSKRIKCPAGFGGARLPRVCETNQRMGANTDLGKCPLDPFTILGDHCTYIDQQRLKLQEAPESVPTGEMPRHINLSCDRYLVDSVKPGTRITCVGIYTSYESRGSRREQDGISDAGILIPYIRVLGIQQENAASDFLLGKFAPSDEEQMEKLSRAPDLYDQIARSVSPAILGSEDIKKAIACMLFGGTRKHLPDGMRLRGDINVLLLGDPSCGKSQFLKFSSKVAPVAVYTSGKGSSAAGLTASILRDPGTGEFHLEGGALVLADGGMVCIDEFDKMREQDRVAIHEAMEQQTISIAKAGITTILNSRTSVLAAANPTFGRYDDMKSPSENIDFQTTILSRFDLIFIIRDRLSFQRDVTIAKHVINIHKNRDAAINAEESAIDSELLKKYIAYARSKCTPRLTETAAEALRDRYVRFRKTMKEHRAKSGGTDSIPITVRQLEAIVRISEALARMQLSEEATEDHVAEAVRLFQVSTMSAATAGAEGVGSDTFNKMVQQAEKFLEKRLGIGAKMSYAKLMSEMISRNFEENAVVSAIDIMRRRSKLQYKNQGKLIQRVKA